MYLKNKTWAVQALPSWYSEKDEPPGDSTITMLKHMWYVTILTPDSPDQFGFNHACISEQT